jgi:hypothetical protein
MSAKMGLIHFFFRKPCSSGAGPAKHTSLQNASYGPEHDIRFLDSRHKFGL